MTKTFRVTPPPVAAVDAIVRQARREDSPWGDITTDTLIDPTMRGKAYVVARAQGIFANGGVLQSVARLFGGLGVHHVVEDGGCFSSGETLACIDGQVSDLLEAERITLNLLQRLSGIATLTRRYVDAIEGTTARILDTRKTTPGLRVLEKFAVRCGGAQNHRWSLSDAVLAKDNHIAALAFAGISFREGLERLASISNATMMIEVEVDSLDQLDVVLHSRVAQRVLLDNFTIDDLRAAVSRCSGSVTLEASGGITLDTVRDVAETGVDFISVGALTHSAPAVDLALDIDVSTHIV